MSNDFPEKTHMIRLITNRLLQLDSTAMVRAYDFVLSLGQPATVDTEVQEKMGENPTLTASEIRRELGQ